MTANRFRFRVWSRAHERYLEHEEHEYNADLLRAVKIGIPLDRSGHGAFLELCPCRHLIAEDYVIEQSIGLLDSQGREIFEGDRVTIDGKSEIYTVRWSKWRSAFYLESTGSREYEYAIVHKCFTITGNIHEGES